jgi:hypothetical protein
VNLAGVVTTRPDGSAPSASDEFLYVVTPTYDGGRAKWTCRWNGGGVAVGQPCVVVETDGEPWALGVGGAIVHVRDFGAYPDGSDVSDRVQAAIDAVALSRGTVLFGAGAYRCNVVAKPRVRLLGMGAFATTLQAVAGSNADVIRGVDFGTLTGKAKATGDHARGAYEVEITDLTIDGDKATQAAGYGVRLWGRAPKFGGKVTVRNCKSGGVWTEFTEVDSFADPEQLLEGHVADLSVHNCDGHGWTHRGPHDTVVSKAEVYSCTGWAVRVEQTPGGYNGGIYFRHLNFFLCANGAYAGGSLFEMHGGAITGETGTGLEFAAGSGGGKIRGVVVAGHEKGIIVRGSSHEIDVQASRNTVVAIELDGAINCRVDAYGVANENVLNIVSEAGPNFITGLFDIGAETFLKAGSAVPNTGGRYLLRGYGGSTYYLNQFPLVSFPPKDPVGVPNRTLFVDATDEILKYKDSGGTLRSLY